MVMAEQLTEPLAYHAEGAVWYPGWGGLKWVDMLAGDILSLDGVTGAVDRFSVGSPVVAAVRPRTGGGFLAVTEREFTLWKDGEREWSSPALWSDGERRFNEGGCDPEGRMLCGSLSYKGEAGQGEVFRLNLDGTTERLWGEVTTSNGLSFNSDGTRMYYVDTRTRRVDVFDYEEGELVNRRPLVSFTDAVVGNPDGIWVDALDGVWIALYGGSAVHHYSSAGVLEDVIELPVTKITSCTFGGEKLETLFITTTREKLEPGEQPIAGSIFTAEVGVRGLPVRPFAG